MKLFKEINESVALKHLQSGFLKSPRSIDAAKAVANGDDSVALNNGKHYLAVKQLAGRALKKGMVVLAKYNTFNQGVDIVKILGVTGDENKHGTGGIKFDSVKEAMDHYGVKTVKELEEKQRKNDYGHTSHLMVEDMEDVEKDQYKRGPWYYLSGGRWVRGSGAEPLSFVLLEEVEPEDDDDNDPVNQIRQRG
jgi:hypothetical protein